MVIELTYLIGSIIAWIVVMEMNSSQDAIWSFYVRDKNDNDELHRWDAIAIAVLVLLLSFGYRGVALESLILGLFFFFMRAGYFSWRMNMKRRPKPLPWNHLGDGRWDRMFEGNETLYFLVCFAGIISSLVWLFKEYV